MRLVGRTRTCLICGWMIRGPVLGRYRPAEAGEHVLDIRRKPSVGSHQVMVVGRRSSWRRVLPVDGLRAPVATATDGKITRRIPPR